MLDYTPSDPGKGRFNKTSLLNSHLLRNGAVGNEEGIEQGNGCGLLYLELFLTEIAIHLPFFTYNWNVQIVV